MSSKETRPVEVVTRDANDPDHPRRNVVDLTDPGVRNWLIGHISWAINNNRTVTVIATSEAVNYFPKDESRDRRRERRAKKYEGKPHGNARVA